MWLRTIAGLLLWFGAMAGAVVLVSRLDSRYPLAPGEDGDDGH
jgi:hypothetical protein